MRRFPPIVLLAAACLAATSAWAIPVYIEGPLPELWVGDEIDIRVLIDTQDVPLGLGTAGVRLTNADPVLDVMDVIPGNEFSDAAGMYDFDLTPPDPGIFEIVDLFDPGAMGPELLTFRVRAANAGTTVLGLEFWGVPMHLGGTFDNFIEWFDPLSVPPGFAPNVLDPLIEFGAMQVVVHPSGWVIPEPCTLVLLGGGLALAALRRRRS